MDGDGASENGDGLGGDETATDVGKRSDGGAECGDEDADSGGLEDLSLCELTANASTAMTAIVTTTTPAARTSNLRPPGGLASGALKGVVKVRRSPAVHIVAVGDRPSRDAMTHRRAVCRDEEPGTWVSDSEQHWLYPACAAVCP